MTNSAKKIGNKGLYFYQKYRRHLKWLSNKILHKIQLYDSDIRIKSVKIDYGLGLIEFCFPVSFRTTCLDPFPNKKQVEIRYSQDPKYIRDVIKYVGMMDKEPTIIEGCVDKWGTDFFKVIVSFRCYDS